MEMQWQLRGEAMGRERDRGKEREVDSTTVSCIDA